MDSIEKLLEEVKAVSQEYEKIAKITGENYNIFDILNVRWDEDSHSRFLANILDPKGMHDCGDIFLRLFFENFLPDKNDIDFSNCNIEREYYSKEFGRPDIFVLCQDFGIVIENKIGAGDQIRQLSRYDDILKEKYKDEKKYRLFYLTLDGRIASKESHCGIKYMRLAYNKNYDNDHETNDKGDNSEFVDNDILKWLECCQEKVFNKPLIRETIEQYINLIKILTGQTRRNKMSEDVVKILAKDAENIKATFEITANTQNLELQKYLISENLVKPLKEWADTKQNGLQIETENIWIRFPKIIIVRKKEWDNQNLRICFEFGGRIGKFENLYYGLTSTKGKLDKDSEITKRLGYQNPYWYKVNKSNKYNNWHRNEFAELSKPDNAIVKYFIDKIEGLLIILKEKNLM